MPKDSHEDIVLFIRDLYPDASPEVLEEAQRNVMDYVAAVLRIFERLERDHVADSAESEGRSRVDDIATSSSI